MLENDDQALIALETSDNVFPNDRVIIDIRMSDVCALGVGTNVHVRCCSVVHDFVR